MHWLNHVPKIPTQWAYFGPVSTVSYYCNNTFYRFFYINNYFLLDYTSSRKGDASSNYHVLGYHFPARGAFWFCPVKYYDVLKSLWLFNIQITCSHILLGMWRNMKPSWVFLLNAYINTYSNRGEASGHAGLAEHNQKYCRVKNFLICLKMEIKLEIFFKNGMRRQ